MIDRGPSLEGNTKSASSMLIEHLSQNRGDIIGREVGRVP
jgi:hypothetical protein